MRSLEEHVRSLEEEHGISLDPKNKEVLVSLMGIIRRERPLDRGEVSELMKVLISSMEKKGIKLPRTEKNLLLWYVKEKGSLERMNQREADELLNRDLKTGRPLGPRLKKIPYSKATLLPANDYLLDWDTFLYNMRDVFINTMKIRGDSPSIPKEVRTNLDEILLRVLSAKANKHPLQPKERIVYTRITKSPFLQGVRQQTIDQYSQIPALPKKHKPPQEKPEQTNIFEKYLTRSLSKQSYFKQPGPRKEYKFRKRR